MCVCVFESGVYCLCCVLVCLLVVRCVVRVCLCVIEDVCILECGCGCVCVCVCVGSCVCVYTYIYITIYICMCVCCVYMLCVHVYPFSSTQTMPKTKSSLVEVFDFGSLKLLTKVKQFGSSITSSLEDVGRKVPSAVLPRVDFKVNFQLLKVSLTSHKITLIYAIF